MREFGDMNAPLLKTESTQRQLLSQWKAAQRVFNEVVHNFRFTEEQVRIERFRRSVLETTLITARDASTWAIVKKNVGLRYSLEEFSMLATSQRNTLLAGTSDTIRDIATPFLTLQTV